MTEPRQTHMVFVDIDPEEDAAFDDWYDNTHLPQILACPGWLEARREKCLEGGPRHVAIYTITGPEAYETPEFDAIKGFGPFTDKIRNFRRVRLTKS
ncbi:DUF4286 family protein [Rhodovulum sulfidophilum]|uniref:DUF4286 family protein n=1 Tax=Rhodovulum sulfidophilum TaxID=35806 RepID=A0ABS1RNE2_RHOSU|nr:DUF4286 family protein [Rhodovulum sulfidophilum]MBL3607560.1 hypothetical protein [Rhodovulum sulfidophilum]MCE8438391.1 hypothetical protein [Rhodovulum sulfidophilum]MCE8456570.1 hypothetical protein [Rhodovulum sulfidophilum]MCE8470893.1 hypothetical protein [Rhodovulum sulfidophilum]